MSSNKYAKFGSASGGGGGGSVDINDSSGNPLNSNGLGALKTDGSAVTQPVSAASLPLPTSASTSALQTTGNTSLSNIDTKTPALVSGRVPVDGSGVTQPVSAASLPLPTGAATSALQTTGNTSLASIATNTTGIALDASVTAVQGSVAGGTVATKSALAGGQYLTSAPTLTNAQQAAMQLDASGNLKVNVVTGGSGSNASVSATGSAVPASATYLAASVAGTLTGLVATANGLKVDGSAVTPKAPVNSTGSGPAAAATVSTVATLTAPANAVGFILQAIDTSSANIRWCIGRTASATLGQQLQPGRDTGFIPCGANVSICAEAGTQNYDIQWISQ